MISGDRRGGAILRLLAEIHEVASLDKDSLLLERRFLSPAVVWGVWTPLLLLGLLTWLFRTTGADLAASQLFYGGAGQWPLRYSEPFASLYCFGTWPGSLLATSGLLLGILGTLSARLRRWRNLGFFLALAFLICPLLLVDSLFKPCWGRPRPIQLEQFGGRYQFVPLGSLGPSTRTRSFPSSHAAAGFYLLVPCFAVWRRRKDWALIFLLSGLSYGALVGLARIVQGAHFPSDIIWSCALVYFSGLMLSAAFGFFKSGDTSPATRQLGLSGERAGFTMGKSARGCRERRTADVSLPCARP